MSAVPSANAVHFLQKQGIDTHGCDISQVAIDRASERGIANCRVASATDLPYADRQFDLVICTDVLEHLYIEDVPLALAELTRVAKRYAVLKPAFRAEKNHRPLEKAKSQFPDLEDTQALHLTVKKAAWWTTQILETGNVGDIASDQSGCFVCDRR